MMRTIHLYGEARKRFGGPYRFDIASPIEAVRMLAQLPGWEQFIRQADWQIIKGPKRADNAIGEDEIALRFGAVDELHLVPLPAGAAKSKIGIGKIVVGVALAAAAIASAGAAAPAGAAFAFGATLGGTGISFGSIALTGAGMILSGVSSLLSQAPTVKSYAAREAPDQQPSFLFNGAVNNTEQGAPIPVAMGLSVRVGSVVASGSIKTSVFTPPSS